MEQGDVERKKDPLNPPPSDLEVHRAAKDPTSRPHPLHPGEPSEVRRDRGVPSRQGHPLAPPADFTAQRHRPEPRPHAPLPTVPQDYEAKQVRGEPRAVPPLGPPSHYEAKQVRGEPRPGAPITPPTHYEAKQVRGEPRTTTPLPTHHDYEARADRGQARTDTRPWVPNDRYEVHPSTSHASPRNGIDLPPPGPVEVKRDQPQRTEMPALPLSAGEVEIQANAGRQKVRVMTTGVFDLIHLGHLRMLEAARALGDELWVVIARDETVRRMKHEPLNGEEVRRQIVEGLKPVTRAVLGNTGDIYRTVLQVRPDVIALGYDQKFEEEEVRRRCLSVGVECQVVRLQEFEHDLDATRKIIERIADRIQRNELYRPG